MKKREELGFWKALASVQRFAIIVTGVGTALIVSGACILRWFNINFAGFEEILVMTAFWLYMVGCAYGSYEKSQITADLLAVMMKDGPVKDALHMIRSILTLVLCTIMFFWALGLVQWSIEMATKTPVFRIPMAIGYGSMLFGLGLSVFYNICYCYDAIKAIVTGRKAAGKEAAA